MKSFVANDLNKTVYLQLLMNLIAKSLTTLISELLNNFFTNIGSNMDSEIPKAAKSYHCPGWHNLLLLIR